MTAVPARLIAAVAVLLVAGCGSGAEPERPDPRDAVAATVDRYYRALLSGDTVAACEMVTSNVARAATVATRAEACSEGLRLVSLELGPEDGPRPQRVEPRQITVDGGAARVRLAVDGEAVSRPLELLHHADGWRISGLATEIRFESPEQAECYEEAASAFDHPDLASDLQALGRDDFNLIVNETCRRGAREGVLDRPRAMERLVPSVVEDLAERGLVRAPG